jgi:hypothetical protein
VTRLIGRHDDQSRIGLLLDAGRLVTVLGPGGAGKTRLAVEAGRRHRHEYRDGAWLVDLAAVTEPAQVGAAVLAAIDDGDLEAVSLQPVGQGRPGDADAGDEHAGVGHAGDVRRRRSHHADMPLTPAAGIAAP